MTGCRIASAPDRLASELADAVALVDGGRWSADRLRSLMGRAEYRGFAIESFVAPRVCMARCPVSGDVARVAWGRPLRSGGGSLGRGAWLVGPAVPVGPGRWVFLGRPVVVGAGAPVSALSSFVGSLKAPRGSLWTVHGALIARTAREWAYRGSGAQRALRLAA